MTGFLANLLARFNQPVAAVRPRPVARFEPQTPLQPSPWLEAETDAIQERPPAHSLQPNHPISPDLTPAPSAPAMSPVSWPKPKNLPDPTPEQPPNREAGSPPVQLGYLVVSMQDHGRTRLLQPESNPAADSGTPESGAAPGFVRRASPKVESQPQRGQPTPPSLKPAFELDEKPSIRPTPHRLVRPPGFESIQLPEHAPPAPAAAEPVITVTIGRVEVIAALPQMPAAKPARSNPVMSLDEYLRSRNQERQP